MATQRGERLVRCIDSSSELLGNAEVAVYYLYYDSMTNEDGNFTAEVVLHPDYSDQWRALVKGSFIV